MTNELTKKTETALDVFGSAEGFELGQRIGKALATSTIVPKAFAGNLGNCLIALNMSHRMKADPLMVMQNLAIVHGVPSFEAKFMIACFNATGKYTSIKYRMFGKEGTDSYGCQAWAIEKATSDTLEGPKITVALAKKEGWWANNPKWQNSTELMLRYRAASWFIRTTDPGVSMGILSKDEVIDAFDEYEEIKDTPCDAVDDEEANGGAEVSIDSEEEKENVQPVGSPKESDAPMGKQKEPDFFNQ